MLFDQIQQDDDKSGRPTKFENTKLHPGTMVDDPESYVHIDWSKNWKYDFS